MSNKSAGSNVSGGGGRQTLLRLVSKKENCGCVCRVFHLRVYCICSSIFLPMRRLLIEMFIYLSISFF
jgi:hypothetical protein